MHLTHCIDTGVPLCAASQVVLTRGNSSSRRHEVQLTTTTDLQPLLGISMRFLQHGLLSSGHSQPGLHLADLLLPGRQLAPYLLQSLSVLLHLTSNPLMKLLEKLFLSLQLLLQLLRLVSQLWDAGLKLLCFRGTSLWSRQPFICLLAVTFWHLSRCTYWRRIHSLRKACLCEFTMTAFRMLPSLPCMPARAAGMVLVD